MALNKLRGPAETWYRSLPTRLFLWNEWKEMLRKNFASKRSLHKALQDMMACVAKPGQLLYEYVFQKLAFIHKLKLPINSGDQVDLILGGINDEQLKFTVQAAVISDPNVLASHFKALDERRVGSAAGTSGRSRSSAKVTETEIFGKGYVEPKSKSRLRCYNCGRYGHMRAACPDNSVESYSRQRAIEYKNVNYIGGNTNAKFFKVILLNGNEIKSYIDPGKRVFVDYGKMRQVSLSPTNRV